MRACTLFASLLLFNAVTQAKEPPEVTDDGLVRSVSTTKAGVYRLPVATFHQYQRVVVAPVSVAYRKGWKQKHPELNAEEREKLSADLARAYREELVRELVERGDFKLAEDPGPDVLRVEASIVNADVTAPAGSSALSQKTYVTSAGSMKTVVELKDAMSGMLIGRIISYEQAPERRDVMRDVQRNPNAMPPPTTPLTNLADFRIGFENSARYTHDAISVAKAEKREEQSQIKSEN